jgi:hypothetical protein
MIKMMLTVVIVYTLAWLPFNAITVSCLSLFSSLKPDLVIDEENAENEFGENFGRSS